MNAAANSAFEGGRIIGADVISSQPETVLRRFWCRAWQLRVAGEGGTPFADELVPVRRRQRAAQCFFKLGVQPVHECRCVVRFPVAAGAEDEGHEAGLAEQCSAIENPLPQASSRVARSAVQSEHRAGEFEFGRVGCVQRADRLVAVAGELLCNVRCGRPGREQRHRVLRCGGENGMREAFAAKNKVSRNVVNPRREVDFATVCKDKAGRSVGKKRTKVVGRE